MTFYTHPMHGLLIARSHFVVSSAIGRRRHTHILGMTLVAFFDIIARFGHVQGMAFCARFTSLELVLVQGMVENRFLDHHIRVAPGAGRAFILGQVQVMTDCASLFSSLALFMLLMIEKDSIAVMVPVNVQDQPETINGLGRRYRLFNQWEAF